MMINEEMFMDAMNFYEIPEEHYESCRAIFDDITRSWKATLRICEDQRLQIERLQQREYDLMREE